MKLKNLLKLVEQIRTGEWEPEKVRSNSRGEPCCFSVTRGALAIWTANGMSCLMIHDIKSCNKVLMEFSWWEQVILWYGGLKRVVNSAVKTHKQSVKEEQVARVVAELFTKK